MWELDKGMDRKEDTWKGYCLGDGKTVMGRLTDGSKIGVWRCSILVRGDNLWEGIRL